MRCQKPETVEPGNRINRSQKIRKTRLSREIMSIGVDRLTEQRDIAHAARDQPSTSPTMSSSGRLRSLPRR